MGITKINSNQSYTGLVQKYIGSAYDKMSDLHAELQKLLDIWEADDSGKWDEIIALAPVIEKAIDDIEDFNDIYYGALPVEPLTAPSGAPTTIGDLYFNSTENQMYVFSADGWEGTGIVDKTIEQFVITSDQAAINVGAPLNISLQFPYKLGSNNAFVFINRLHVFAQSVGAPPNGKPGQNTYLEIDNRTIQFPAGTFVEDDLLVIGVNTEVSTVSHRVDVEEVIITTTTSSQQIIILPQEMYYIPGEYNIEVHVDIGGGTWNRQIIGLDFEETDPLTLTFLQPLPLPTKVLVTRGKVISNEDPYERTIFSITKPDEALYDNGQFWFDTSRGRMFMLYIDVDGRQWISLTGEDDLIINSVPVPPTVVPPVQVRETIVQDAQPDPSLYSEGALWFKTSSGELFFLYDDPTPGEAHWVKVST